MGRLGPTVGTTSRMGLTWHAPVNEITRGDIRKLKGREILSLALSKFYFVLNDSLKSSSRTNRKRHSCTPATQTSAVVSPYIPVHRA
jgi:hypothetical protein